jgi:hypothetical protein
MRTIRIGNGAGFWGDSLDAPRRLVESTPLDFLTLEYLAELTLSILAHQKSRDPNAGFVADVVPVISSLVPAIQSQPRLRIVTNGGGMNPDGCAGQVARVLLAAGLGDVTIGVASGDDLLPLVDPLQGRGESFANLDDPNASFASIRPRLASANAYLGAEGIVECLEQGARIVITGRVADASLTVGPAIHEFGWKQDDVPFLAAATVAGHLIECGAQVTGGMCTAWNGDYSLSRIGYPVAEIDEAGHVWITKPPGTGGRVSPETVSEQLVYEIGDPRAYLTPDVTADFSNVQLVPDGIERVAVRGAAGTARPDRLKVSASYRDGYLAVGTLVVCGREAIAAACETGRLVIERVEAAGVKPRNSHVEVLGRGDVAPGLTSDGAIFETVVRVAVHTGSKADADRFIREFSPLVGSGPPGVTGYTGPRARPVPVFSHWPTTIAREHVGVKVGVSSAAEWAAGGAS